jgi:DNA primase
VGRISEDDVARVRDATDLVQLVSETVPLNQKGRLFWGRCPFHGEKTPSFKLDPATQLWHCFGCGLGGDAFGFVMRSENLDFPDAVRRLADRARIEIIEEAGGAPAGQKERLLAACEATADFYHKQLTGSREAGPAKAREYLKSRCFNTEVAKRFRLGYAPGRAQLSAHLGKQGFTADEIVLANLAMRDERTGKLRDRFYERVMFPITDLSGRVIAFGGRVLGSGEPKYLNSSDTPVFHKSANMYGISMAKADIVRTGVAVVVEGYTDVIALHEAGMRNAVATLGTALTPQHVKLLGRFAKNVVYLFDGDEAGMRAADRAGEFLDWQATPEAGSARIDLKVALIPDGMDPADYVGAKGADGMQPVVDNAQPLLRFVLDRRLAQHDLTSPEGRSRALDSAVRVLAGIRGSLLAQDYANYLAGRLSTDYATVLAVLKDAKPEPAAAQRAAAGAADAEAPGVASQAPAAARRAVKLDARERAELELMRLLTLYPVFRTQEVRELLAGGDAMASPETASLASAVLDAGTLTGQDLYAAVSAALGREAAEPLSAWLTGGDADRDGGTDGNVEAAFRETVARLKDFGLRRQILTLQARMAATDGVKDPTAYDELFRGIAMLRRAQEQLRASDAMTDDTEA